MAYRRVAWIGKSLKSGPSYKPISPIPQSLEGYNRTLSVLAVSKSRLLPPYSSSLSKHKIRPQINLSMNMSTSPHGNEKFHKNFEAEDDKRLMNIATGIHTQLVKTEEKLEEVETLLEETIGELKGFMSFLKWDFRDERLNGVEGVLCDVESRFNESFDALDRLSESVEEGKMRKIEDLLIDICGIKLRKIRCLEGSKEKSRLLKELVESRVRCQFYMSFLHGG